MKKKRGRKFDEGRIPAPSKAHGTLKEVKKGDCPYYVTNEGTRYVRLKCGDQATFLCDECVHKKEN